MKLYTVTFSGVRWLDFEFKPLNSRYTMDFEGCFKFILAEKAGNHL